MMTDDNRIIKTRKERILYGIQLLKLGFDFIHDARLYLQNNKLFQDKFEVQFQLAGKTLMDIAKDIQVELTPNPEGKNVKP